jgi:nucleoside-diphosphate-sugar epimerase
VLTGKPVPSGLNPRVIPIIFPHLLRRIKDRKSNWGDIRYSAAKINQAGFQFNFDVQSATEQVLSISLGFSTDPLHTVYPLEKGNQPETLVILGATGFIGRNLVQKLSGIGQLLLRILIQSDEQKELFDNIPNASVFKGTLLNYQTIERLFVPGCTVINLAYLESDTQSNNLIAADNLSRACVDKQVKRMVHCSTANVVGNTKQTRIDEKTECIARTDYEKTKLMIEEALIASAAGKYELAILRPTAVFGPGGRNLIKLADSLTKKHWFSNYLLSCVFGKRSMNLVCLENVISSIIFLCTSQFEANNNIFIISDDNNPKNTFKDIEETLLKKLNLRQYPIYRLPLPTIILKVILCVFKRPVTETKRKFVCGKLVRMGYEKTTTIEEELDRFAQWYLNRNYRA